MKNFESLITTRRSMRKFTDELLTSDEVTSILKAGLMAPASKRSNPWQFIVVEDKEMLAHLSKTKEHGSAFIKDCALAVVVTASAMASDVWVEDASVASIYMQLQAEDLGLGSCWCQIRNRLSTHGSEAQDYVRNLLNIPYQLEVLSIIAFGHKGMERKPFNEEHLQWEKIHLDEFKLSEFDNKEEE